MPYTLAVMGILGTPADPASQTRRVLYAAAGISVLDFRCRAHMEPEGPEEPTPSIGRQWNRRKAFRAQRS